MLQQNIKVAIRVRPLQANEIIFKEKKKSLGPQDDESKTIFHLADNILLFKPSKSRKKYSDKRQFRFDCLLGTNSTQEDVFEKCAKPLISSVLGGFNCTLFAYGATGCGKTHTITGTENDPGLIYKTVQELFNEIEQLKKADNEVKMTVSFLEVYNETVKDLFHPGKPLDLREDNENDRIHVAGISEKFPDSLDQVMALLIIGNSNRSKASTAANATSSRSHAVLQIYIKNQSKLNSTEYNVKRATLSIIDLAGSERASVTLNEGERLNEGANINRSLLALGNCINALEKSSSYIPFRDSKLTRLLKYSLSGNCSVVMIACVSPALVHAEDTLNTLKYADRAKEIKTKIYQNTIDAAHYSHYPMIIQNLKEEIQRLKSSDPLPTPHIYIKMEKYYSKLEEKERLLIKADFKNRWNKFKADKLQSLLVLLNEREASAAEIRSWNCTILQVNEAIDVLMAEKTINLHNTEEHRRAVSRYRERLQKLLLETPSLKQQSKICQMNMEVALSAAIQSQTQDLLHQVQENEMALSSISIKFALSSDTLSFSKYGDRLAHLFDKLREAIMGIQDNVTPIYDETSASELDDSFGCLEVLENGENDVEMILPIHVVHKNHQDDDENDATPVQRRFKKTIRSVVKKCKSPWKRRASLLPLPRKSSRLTVPEILMQSD